MMLMYLVVSRTKISRIENKQDKKVKVLCIPTNSKPSESQKMNDMLGVFLKMIDRIKEYEEIDRINREKDCLSSCDEGHLNKPVG